MKSFGNHLALFVMLNAAATTGARAGSLEARFVRERDVPRLTLTLRAAPPAAGQPADLRVPVQVYAAAAEAGAPPLWSGVIEMPLAGDAPWTAELALGEAMKDRGGRYRVALRKRHAELTLDYRETLMIERPDAVLQSYGYRKNGEFPDQTVQFTCSVIGFRLDTFRDLSVGLTVTDEEHNLVLDSIATIRPDRQTTWHTLDMTPRGPDEPSGPFRSSIAIESDVYNLHFRTSHTFAWANAYAPVTSMEDGRPATWFAAHGEPPTTTHSLGYYYSPHLGNFNPANEPRIAYDETVRHSGTRALRVDYRAGHPTFIWGRRTLPGKPLYMLVWIKGNASGDRLSVIFEDHINYALAGWGRRADFSTETVCVLDFEGWRRFRVPVLGMGHQFDSFAGSSANIDAPIGIKAFRIEPAAAQPANAPEERRTIWIGSLGAETQVRPAQRVSLERRIGDADGMLRSDDTLTVSIGNGWSQPLRRGRVSITAQDRAGERIYSAQQDLEVPGNDYAVTRFPLAPLAALDPAGPVDIDIVFLDTTVSGARVASRLTLKAPRHGGVFEDFEEPTVFSGFQPGTVLPPASRIVKLPTGAALELPFAPEVPAADGVEAAPPVRGSALLHPRLPGQVASVTLRARATGASAILQPWLIDGGETGVGNRPYNVFWAEAIELEADGDWRDVTFAAPPVPPFYQDRGRSFLFEPYYPLNLAFQSRPLDPERAPAGAVLIDQVRLVTHVGEDETLTAAIVLADDSTLLRPGAPLELVVRSYAPEPLSGRIGLRLRNSQGRVVVDTERDAAIAAGQKHRLQLLDRITAGIYTLDLDAFGRLARRETLIAIDPVGVFGEDYLDVLRDLVGLRLRLGQDREPLDLDWDNSEPVPGAHQFGWFSTLSRARSAEGRLTVVPVFGYSAEWAGPESAAAIARGEYQRYISNFYQIPQRLIDWDVYVREALREFGPRFGEYAFWDNPDSADSPQYIPPERYRGMLASVYRWTRLYAPESVVTAGGFNYDRALPYLDRIEDVETLPFDRIAVRMNVGELSPEAADFEGFLDELDARLNLGPTGRSVLPTDCDWGIGRLLTPIEHAAYHARTLLILDSRGAARHRFGLVNPGYTFEGYGLFHRQVFGNLDQAVAGFGDAVALQHLKPFHVPKPAFFALRYMNAFLERHTFIRAVDLPDLSRDRNRVFLYAGEGGRLTAVLWRAHQDRQRYHWPEAWRAAPVRDAFGFDVEFDAGVFEITPLPYLVELPADEVADNAVHLLRHLADEAGAYPVALDLYTVETDSARRAAYAFTGETYEDGAAGRLPGRPRRRLATIRRGVESEQFVFASATDGDALLTRRWRFEAGGQRVWVQLNDGAEQEWDLRSAREDEPGWRDSTFVLRGVREGSNTVAVRYETAGNSLGYRVEPLEAGAGWIDATRWGLLHARQTRGDMLLHQSTVGTPLRIGNRTYATGFGAHATSLLELPLDGQFRVFEVTVGIDGHTEGRGSVRFRIFADDREVAQSGIVTGLSEPITLRVEDLESARRLLLSVDDADDGDANDLANWVDACLFMR